MNMFFKSHRFLAALALPALSVAFPAAGNAEREVAPHLRGKRSFEVRDGVNHTIFEHEATGATMSFVTNSGICETTAGVNQYSGYLSVGSKLMVAHEEPQSDNYLANENMWFWFFESRNNPTTAPLATWFNGGPGCSSMIGLFQVLKLPQ